MILFVPPTITPEGAFRDVNPLPPIGLGYIAAVLRQRGIEVRIYDSLLEKWEQPDHLGNGWVRIGPSGDEIEAILREYAPDIVGVNNIFSRQWRYACEIYARAKAIDANIITIAAGAHTTVMPSETLADPNVDYVVIGEGEQSVEDILDYVEGKRDEPDFDGVGLKINGKPIIHPKTHFITNLDGLPFPDWEAMKLERYFSLHESHGARRRERYAPIVTSRGCPVGCTFCTAHCVWGKRCRHRSIENIIIEMRLLKNRYGLDEILFEDDNLTLNRDRAKALFRQMVEEEFGFVWDTPNGVAAWTLDEELLVLMKASGCVCLNVALESGCQEVLDNIIRKPVKLDRVETVFRKARQISLPVNTFFIIGMPGETIKQMEETFRYAARHGFYSPFISVATPYPGSQLHKICLEKKLFVTDYNLEDLYIRSFPLRTADWEPADLRQVLNWGIGYLYRAKVLADFGYFLQDVLDNISRPWYLLMRIMDLINPRIRARLKRLFKIERTA